MATGEEKKNNVLKLKPQYSDYLNTVRLLHETIVCLRKALERSQSELSLLKTEVVTADSLSPKYCGTIEQLTLENHVLRRRILLDRYPDSFSMDDNSDSKDNLSDVSLEANDTGEDQVEIEENSSPEKEELPASDFENINNEKISESKNDSDEYDEVDNIEVIFTTDDSKIEVQEKLESVSDNEDISQSKSDISQSAVSNPPVLTESDMAKNGVVDKNDSISSQEKERSKKNVPKITNAAEKVTLTETSRPILNKVIVAVRDSEAQTDITALPSTWKSENLVNNTTSYKFPLLPSKFVIPVKGTEHKCYLRRYNKLPETRRSLSGINFASCQYFILT